MHEHKIKLINDNCKRAKINNVNACVCDGTLPNEKYINTADRVLCDVPCSGLGMIFKKPDIKYKDIDFIYRCHPVWVHPEHQGVNSINRVKNFFEFLDAPNLKMSGNIPKTDLKKFQLSFVRSSLEEDLKEVDLVIGEHSISMIDAAMQGIPFVSVNLTKRRNFFSEISALGFPHCKSEKQLMRVLDEYSTEEFRNDYVEAISKYNNMVNVDEE